MAMQYAWKMPFFENFDREIRVSEYCQALLLAFAIPGGFWQLDRLRFLLAAAIAYWIALAIIMIRRNSNATQDDRTMLKYGFIITLFLTWMIAKSMGAETPFLL